MSIGLSIGMCIGMAIGSAKDKRLSENIMEISRIEDVCESSDKLIYAIDKYGIEKEYRVTDKKMKKEKFSVGDEVVEDTGRVLMSVKNS